MPRLSTHWRVSTSTRCHVAMDTPCSSHGTIRRVTKTSWRRYPFMTLIIREKQLLTVYKNFRSSCKFFMCFVSFFVASIMSWGEVGNTVCMPKQKCPKLKKKRKKNALLFLRNTAELKIVPRILLSAAGCRTEGSVFVWAFNCYCC